MAEHLFSLSCVSPVFLARLRVHTTPVLALKSFDPMTVTQQLSRGILEKIIRRDNFPSTNGQGSKASIQGAQTTDRSSAAVSATI